MTTHLRPVARYFETRPLSVTITLCWRCAQCKSVMYCRTSPCRAFTFILIGRMSRIVYAPGHGPFCCVVSLQYCARLHSPMHRTVRRVYTLSGRCHTHWYICWCILMRNIFAGVSRHFWLPLYILLWSWTVNIHNVGSHFITSKTYFPSVYLDNILFMYYNLSNDQKQ